MSFEKIDLHTHTTFSDGANTPEEMVKEAIALGMSEIGFSDHSFLEFDPSYCMKEERIGDYKAEVNRLKEVYKDQISVKLGIEQDYLTKIPAEGYDYVIGSVHYVTNESGIYAVDDSVEIFEHAIETFGNDPYALCEAYFETIADVVRKTNCDIIGHFDLVSKFNERYSFFDEKDPRYVAAWQKAADILIATGKIFEINTGGISRAWRTDAYPSKAMRTYIKEHGGEFILSSDCHKKECLMYAFETFGLY